MKRLAIAYAAMMAVVGVQAQDGNYTNGFWVLSEDWYGHQNSTVNWMTTPQREWYYRVFQEENPGRVLGCTSQYGTVFADKLFIVSKQDRDPGDDRQGGRLTVCDARSLQLLAQLPGIGQATASNGYRYQVDGRAFAGYDEHKGYLTTNNGVWVVDLHSLSVVDSVRGTTHQATGYDRVYTHQCGSIVRAAGKMFVAHQQRGLLVIDPATDSVVRTVAMPEEVAVNPEVQDESVEDGNFDGAWDQRTSVGSVVLAKDGFLYCSVANRDGMGGRMNYLLRVDPVTYATQCINLMERYGAYGPANTWYSWTPDCFCASTQRNVLYWNGGPEARNASATIYQYDIDRDECAVFVDLSASTRRIYGCSFRVDPTTDHAMLSVQEKSDVTNPGDFGRPLFLLQEYDAEGTMLGEWDMIENYWFPSIPIFPDLHAPQAVVGALDYTFTTTGEAAQALCVDLSQVFADADDMASAMCFRLTSSSRPDLLDARVEGKQLLIDPLQRQGNATLTVQADSRGRVAEAQLNVTLLPDDSAVEGVRADLRPKRTTCDLLGRVGAWHNRGANIVVSDGRKSLCK